MTLITCLYTNMWLLTTWVTQGTIVSHTGTCGCSPHGSPKAPLNVIQEHVAAHHMGHPRHHRISYRNRWMLTTWVTQGTTVSHTGTGGCSPHGSLKAPLYLIHEHVAAHHMGHPRHHCISYRNRWLLTTWVTQGTTVSHTGTGGCSPHGSPKAPLYLIQEQVAAHHMGHPWVTQGTTVSDTGTGGCSPHGSPKAPLYLIQEQVAAHHMGHSRHHCISYRNRWLLTTWVTQGTTVSHTGTCGCSPHGSPTAPLYLIQEQVAAHHMGHPRHHCISYTNRWMLTTWVTQGTTVSHTRTGGCSPHGSPKAPLYIIQEQVAAHHMGHSRHHCISYTNRWMLTTWVTQGTTVSHTRTGGCSPHGSLKAPLYLIHEQVAAHHMGHPRHHCISYTNRWLLTTWVTQGTTVSDTGTGGCSPHGSPKAPPYLIQEQVAAHHMGHPRHHCI